jgi:rhomboid protease GluP
MHASSLLLITNGAIYAACAASSGRLQFNAAMMPGWGAISTNTLITHEYWRLLTAGFLHFDLLHLLFNMMWLMSFGSILEKRVGTTYFLMIFCAALVFGNFVTVLAQPGPFAGAGASGAVGGILGALVCLQLLGKPAMSPQTLISNIAINIGFNVVLASSIGWRTHLGGFTAGLIACAILDLIERFNPVGPNCKFPEFIKLNLSCRPARRRLALLDRDLRANQTKPSGRLSNARRDDDHLHQAGRSSPGAKERSGAFHIHPGRSERGTCLRTCIRPDL